MKLSIIIPTFNEATCIGETISYLRKCLGNKEVRILISDGGSSDDTIALVEAAGAEALSSPAKGRAVQMNFGAAQATGEVLYFLHADTLPPTDFYNTIEAALAGGADCGCYRMRFDANHWFLKANAWFTRFRNPFFRFGDQSLFVRRQVFENTGGFREDHIVMEDQELIRRLGKNYRFVVLPQTVTTSARKYLANGVYRTQGTFFVIYMAYQLGMSQARLLHLFRRLLPRQDKL